jgi:hypothetical protein
MKRVKVLCAMLVLGSPACELSVAAEADPGARHVETTHDGSSTNHARAKPEPAPAPAKDGRGTDQRSASDTGAGHDHAAAPAKDGGHADRGPTTGDPAARTGRSEGKPRQVGESGGRSSEGRPRQMGESGARPRQVVQSRGRTVRPSNVRTPQADGRVAGNAGPPRVGSSPEPVAAVNVARNQGAPPGFHAAARPVRSVPTAAVAAAGGPRGHGPASVGGPAPAKIANSGTINGTTARRRF